MPAVGDQVIYYTHEGSDSTHRAIDQLAFVTGIAAEHEVYLVVFPPGQPPIYPRVSSFDPDMPLAARTFGASYWRPTGTDAPDFNAVFAPDAPPIPAHDAPSPKPTGRRV